jgi:hypothetical protein
VISGIKGMPPLRVRTIRQFGPDVAIEALLFGVR